MELPRPSAKRRRSEDQATGEPPPRATEGTEAANPAHPEPPPPDAGGDDVDRVSGLPDAILGEILSLLSTKEAGRTQILASRWRQVWLASPLVLDGADLCKKPKVVIYDDSEDSDEENEKAFTAACEAFASKVSHVLSTHPGPVRRFRIPTLYLHNFPATLDAWLSSPTLDSLQKLEFWLWSDMVWYIRPHPLPSPPASTFRFSATLRAATLCKCELLDGSLQGIHLPYLKQPGLEEVSTSEGSLHTIISTSCPALEYLLIKDIIGVSCLRISSNSLISIGVGAFHPWGNDHPLLEVVIVDAPCLVRFLYLDKPMDLTVISAPKLETLGCLKDVGVVYGREVARVVIGTTTIQGLNIVSLTEPLSNVKILAVASRCIDLDKVIELLKCFPCLEKLYIKSPISREMNRWRRKHRDFNKSFDIRLKTVVLDDYRGIRSHANFASFFLLNARELQSMRIEVQFRDYNEAFITKQHGMLQMLKWASGGARLHFRSRKVCTPYTHVHHVRDLAIVDPFECRCPD